MPSASTPTTSTRTSMARTLPGRPVDRTATLSKARDEGASLVPAGSLDAPESPSRERWVTKRQLAAHLQVTARWIELQYPHGLPHVRRDRIVRYRISEVERWMRDGEQTGVLDAAQ
jgi:hypothetical protein